MKHLNTYITEYIIKKKLDNPIDSSGYKYHPNNKEKLICASHNLPVAYCAALGVEVDAYFYNWKTREGEL